MRESLILTSPVGNDISPERVTWAWWLAVYGLVGLVLAPTLAFEFVWDDGWTLVGNGFLRRPQAVSYTHLTLPTKA